MPWRDSSLTGLTSLAVFHLHLVHQGVYTSVTPVSYLVVLFKGNISEQSQVSHASVNQAKIHFGQSKGHCPVGNLCIVMGAPPYFRYQSLLCLRWGSHMWVWNPRPLKFSCRTRYHTSHSGSGMAFDGTCYLAASMTQGDRP